MSAIGAGARNSCCELRTRNATLCGMHRNALDRRAFLRGGLRTGLGLGLLGSAGLSLGSCAARAAAHGYSISLAQWSLHRALQGRAEPGLDPLDFPAAARELDIGAIEYVNSFYQGHANDEPYLAELRNRCDSEGVKSLLIMCDGEGRLGDPDAAARQQAVEKHHRWVRVAAFLGCHAIRVNAQSAGGRDEQQKLVAEGLRALCEYGAEHEISVLVENHGGLSSDASWLVGVMQQVDHPGVGTLPDFGNFRIGGGEEYDRYQGVEELMPWAKAVSAKSYAFDDAGIETTIDFARMMDLVTAAGYRGFVGVEFEGSADEREGIRKTRDLLRKIRTGD